MNDIIQNLKNTLSGQGFIIFEEKQNDDFYICTVPHKEATGFFTIYTTKKAVEMESESCWRLYFLESQIPFNVITAEVIERFVWKYESFCLRMDLPMQSNFKSNDSDIFLYVYLDRIKKSDLRMDTYKYINGITTDEVMKRIML